MLTAMRRITLPVLGSLCSLLMVCGIALGAGTTDTLPSGSVTVTGLDLHDGMVLQDGSVYYMYGTRYGCGFNWGHSTIWCGDGVSEAPSLAGPWSTPKLLFSNEARIEATGWSGDNGETWSEACGVHGQGCFNPRMVQAADGKWELWLNAPGDKSKNVNPYWVLSCSGPAGPCGSPHKPAVYSACSRGGDFTVEVIGGRGWMECSGHEHELMVERLEPSLTDAADDGYPVPGTDGESPGVFRTASGYEMTMADPGCGYCSGTKTAAKDSPVASDLSYATAPSMAGPWTYKGHLAGPCTGEARSVFSNGSAMWEWVDMWNGTGQETDAGILLVPLAQSPLSCQS